ncbi:MAG: phage tail tape measure protein [Solirubrobacteraceae bacterium]
MAFNAGSVEVILGGQFNPAGFIAYDSAVKRSAANATAFERGHTAAMARGSRATGGLGSAMGALGISSRVLAAGGVAALAAVTVKAAATYAGFQKELLGFKAVSGATARQMSDLESASRSMGISSGLGATKVAQAATELAKGGLSVQKILGGGLQAAITLSVAGQLDLAAAASTVANALNLFGLSGKDAGHVADALAQAANSTTADVSDFAMALSQGGAAAKQAGLSFDQTIVALEALAAAGVKNSDAGTSLKSALMHLVKPTSQAKEVMDRYGLSFFTSGGRMKSMAQVSTMLRSKLGGLTAQQRLQALQTLAGTDGFRTLAALYDQGTSKIHRYGSELKKQGQAAEVAKAKQSGLSGAWDKAKAGVQELWLALGKKVTPALTEALNSIAKKIGEMAKDGSFDHIGEGLATLVKLIGAAAPIVMDLVHALLQVNNALFDPKTLAAGADAFLGAVTSVGDGLMFLLSTMQQVHEAFGIGPDLTKAMGSVQQGLDRINTLREELRGDPFIDLKVNVDGVEKVIEGVSRLDAVVIPPKALKVLMSDQDAKGKLRALVALGIPPKIAKVATTAPTALAQIRALTVMLRGVPASKVIRILHNAPSARAAVKAFDAVLAGVPVSKVIRILHNAPSAKSAVDRLDGAINGLPSSKQSRISAPGASGATGQVQGLAGSIAGLHDKSITVTTWFREVHTASVGKNAAGRGPGAREASIIGEGAGPEWKVNRRTGRAFRTAGPMLTGLGPDDYVIPTETRYRGRALGLLASLAADLGVPGFAAGRGPNRGGTTSRKVGGFWVPKRIAWGGVEFSTLTSKQESLHGDLTNAKQDVSQARASVRELNGKAGTAKAKRELRAAERKRDKLAAQVKVIDREVTAARRTYNQTENLKTDIDNASDLMRIADTKGDAKAYGTAKGNRARLLGNLIAVLKRAYGLSSKNTDYGRSLKRLLSQAGVDLADTNAAKITEPAAPELLSDAEKGVLGGLEAAVSVAGLTVQPDAEHGVADTRADDIAAESGLVGFWQGVFDRAQRSGNSAFIKEAADSLKTARDTLGDLTRPPDTSEVQRPPSPEEIAKAAAEQVSGLNAEVMAARSQFGSNIAGAGHTFINNYAAPPPDPHVWAESQRFAARTAFG